MADTSTDTSALPPKLNLRERAAPATPVTPAPKKPVEIAAPEASTASTMRINLAADAGPATAATIAAPAKPTPVISARPKPASPAGTVRLKAKPKPVQSAARPVAAPVAAGSAPTAAKPVTLKPTPMAVKPKSVKLKPATVGIAREAADPKAPTGSKRETSKIPLESATAPTMGDTPAPVGTKTIRIKPASLDAMKLSGPVPTPAAGGPTAPVPDAKRQTSRISLEAALGAPEGEEKSTGPKTIRLKRPSEAPTVRMQKPPAGDDSDMRKTAQIDALQDMGAPDTQKKTIKVKRPSQSRSVKSVSVKRATGDSTAAVAAAVPVSRPQAIDTVHWTFIFASIAAMIVACVLVYVLCAQVLGPNVSLTQLAYGAPDAELPWPGRISR